MGDDVLAKKVGREEPAPAPGKTADPQQADNSAQHIEVARQLISDCAAHTTTMKGWAEEFHPLLQALKDSGIEVPQLDRIEARLVHMSIPMEHHTAAVLNQLDTLPSDQRAQFARLTINNMTTIIPKLDHALGTLHTDLRNMTLALKDYDFKNDAQESAVIAMFETMLPRAGVINSERHALAASLKQALNTMGISDVGPAR